jgi:hypothetical protein
LEAGEFLRVMGYPTEVAALHMVQDSNIAHILYYVDDIKRFYDFYRPQVPELKGRATKKHAKRQTMVDSMLKMQITHQEMMADVMHVAKERFFVSISSPLELLMVYHIKTQSASKLAHALQQHINTL